MEGRANHMGATVDRPDGSVSSMSPTSIYWGVVYGPIGIMSCHATVVERESIRLQLGSLTTT